MPNLAAVILAAGQGTRMQSKIPKILHEIGGRPMVSHVFDSAVAVANQPPILIVTPGDEKIRTLFGEGARYVDQPEQLGTGHATMMAEPVLRGRTDQVLVTYADMPLLRATTMRQMANCQAETNAAVVMLTVLGDSKSTFGRVLRDVEGRVVEIIEVAQAKQHPNGEKILSITELNVGVYCFAAGWLWENLHHLPIRQARAGQEYYLTDMIELAVSQNQTVEVLTVKDTDECLGAGTRSELITVDRALRRRINQGWLNNGVTIIDPDSTYIDVSVTIGQDSIIRPNSYLEGETNIGQNSVVGPNAIIRHSFIGDNCHIEQAVLEHCTIRTNTRIAPFTHLKDSTIGSE